MTNGLIQLIILNLHQFRRSVRVIISGDYISILKICLAIVNMGQLLALFYVIKIFIYIK